MIIPEARAVIVKAVEQMNTLFGGTVFDEWAMVSFKPGQNIILTYQGPRAEAYTKKFAEDVRLLRTELAGEKLVIGDFAFVQTATGTQHDACMRLGETGFLFCNNTTSTMEEIRKNPGWLKAQTAFLRLSETFRADPLE